LDHMMCRFAHALTVLGAIPRPRAIALAEPLRLGAPLRLGRRGQPAQRKRGALQLDFQNLPRLGESEETCGHLRPQFAQTREISNFERPGLDSGRFEKPGLDSGNFERPGPHSGRGEAGTGTPQRHGESTAKEMWVEEGTRDTKRPEPTRKGNQSCL
jgi:hypothetical protein